MQIKLQYTNKAASHSTTGFTLLELIIVVALIGILSAIAAPAWLEFINRQRLNSAQNQVYTAMQEAKSNAKVQKVTWQFSLRQELINGKPIVQWAVHRPDPVTPNHIPTHVIWNNFDPNIQVYKEKNEKGSCETTFNKTGDACPSGPWRVQFNYIGNTNALGQITLTTKNGSKIKRCIYVSTLIGTIRTGKEHAKANNSNKYCY